MGSSPAWWPLWFHRKAKQGREKTENCSAEASAAASVLGRSGQRAHTCRSCETPQPLAQRGSSVRPEPPGSRPSPRPGAGKVRTALGAQPRSARPSGARSARRVGTASVRIRSARGQTAQPAGGAPGRRGPGWGLPRSGFPSSASSSKLGLKPEVAKNEGAANAQLALDTLALLLCEAALSGAWAGTGSVLGTAESRVDSTEDVRDSPGSCSSPLLSARGRLGEGPGLIAHTW